MKSVTKIFLFFPFLLVSCDSKMVFEKNEKIPEAKWNAENKIIFETTITDTISFHDLYINIRNSGEYQYSNLYVFADVFSPDTKIERDTIECILADVQGRWLGKSGSGGIWYNQILFKTKKEFSKQGKYVFRFEQAMRTKELEHILDIGLRIEKSN